MPAAPTLTSRSASTPKPAALTFASFEDLQAFARARLCVVNAWSEDAATLQAAPLTRASLPCGWLFRARGPKRLTAHAIWANAESRLLIYDTAGRRAEEAAVVLLAGQG